MMNFHNLTPKELEKNGLKFKTESDAQKFASIIREELEVRVGNEISRALGPEKTEEFHNEISAKDAKSWLNENCPQHNEIINTQQTVLYKEIMKYKEEIPGLVKGSD